MDGINATTDTLLPDDEVVGEVLGLFFSDARTGFGVAEVATEGGDFVRATGPLADLVEGQRVGLVGRWTDHARYGPTFAVTMYEQLVPTTSDGMRSFLLSERFNIEPEVVERVIKALGDQVGHVIEHQPERLVTEADLDAAEATALHDAWVRGHALAELQRITSKVNLPDEVVRAIHGRFGGIAPRLAREEPYRLLEVPRVRFAHADALGRLAGIASTDPARLAAGARACVGAAVRERGDQCVPRPDVVDAAANLLRVDAILAADGIDRGIAMGLLAQEEIEGRTLVYTAGGHRAETSLAAEVARLNQAPARLGHLADAGADADGDELTDGQRQAVEAAFRSPLSILTGGPGTGKTRTVASIVAVAEDAGLTIALAAPTGRAAKRIEEVVGHPATTIHRLLEARPMDDGGFAFKYGDDEQLPHDLLVIDEVSMCDTWLAASLCRAIETGTHIVVVGDPDQLPSVGSGDVLRDLVSSGVITHTELTQVHRQAAGSRIVGLAHEVNHGQVDHLRGVDGDVFLAEDGDHASIVDRVVSAVAERATARLGVKPDDVQVLAPVYRGPVGVDALNAALKQRLNPAAGRRDLRGFHDGDRVMQTRNDPDRDISNGDIGVVSDLNLKKKELRVVFPRGEVKCDREQVADLTHAWCVTVHKSQGGEWPVVVLVVDRSHRGMLWRNLLYTAITRAQRALIIIGQADAVRRAAHHDRPRNRTTGLVARLRRPDA